jgi:hypothetical protein
VHKESLTVFDIRIIPASCRVTRCGVLFEEAITFQEWADFGKRLVIATESIQWMIGDWLNWGHAKYDRTKYTVALEALPYKYQTLANFSYVAGRIEFSRRRENLRFNHHLEVAGFEPKKQNHYLRLAEREGWGVADLRQHIRQSEAVFKNEKRITEKGPYTLCTQLHLWLIAQRWDEWDEKLRAMWKAELKPIAEVYERL